METTVKTVCNILVDVLRRHGVRRFFVSPGSRNAPLIVALARRNDVEKYVIVDERSAAFAALGMAQQTGEPVGLVCTSGTALLNYAPAVAEAFYQKLPLVVVSADRPREWIDQDDSQTIRQYEALGQFVKKSYDLPARCDDATARWYANRIVNDAVAAAMAGQKAPVHINVQIDEPLGALADAEPGKERLIEAMRPAGTLSDDSFARLAAEAAGKRILIVAGFGSPNPAVEDALRKMAGWGNVAVLTETVANLRDGRFVEAVDRTLLAIQGDDLRRYSPDVLITFGGALVSRMVKSFLRQYRPAAHWHVGVTEATVDCMQSLTRRVMVAPEKFFVRFASLPGVETDNGFAALWREACGRGRERHDDYVRRAGWSDLKAFSVLLPAVPADFRLQLSNGTAIRYAQLFGDRMAACNFCNRGVSGIDGSTSTALGASLAYSGVTLLITGDMSFSYDLSGLASGYNSRRLKIAVMQNGGGGIFRFVGSTAKLPELEEYFEVRREVPVRRYAEAFGFAFFEAGGEEALRRTLPAFFKADRPAILAVKTDGKASADVLNGYFGK